MTRAIPAAFLAEEYISKKLGDFSQAIIILPSMPFRWATVVAKCAHSLDSFWFYFIEILILISFMRTLAFPRRAPSQRASPASAGCTPQRCCHRSGLYCFSTHWIIEIDIVMQRAHRRALVWALLHTVDKFYVPRRPGLPTRLSREIGHLWCRAKHAAAPILFHGDVAFPSGKRFELSRQARHLRKFPVLRREYLPTLCHLSEAKLIYQLSFVCVIPAPFLVCFNRNSL